MRNLIRSELYKLFKAKYLYACLASLCAMLALVFVMMMLLPTFAPEGATEAEVLAVTMGGTLEWIGEAFSAGDMLVVFIAIAICLLVVGEFRAMTIKNMLPVSSRTEIYLAKLLAALVAVAVMVLGALVWCLALGLARYGDFADVLRQLPFLLKMAGVQIAAGFASAGLYVMLSFLIRNIAVALPVCLLFHAVLMAALQGLGLVSELYMRIMRLTPPGIAGRYVTPEAFAADPVWLPLLCCAGVAAAAFGVGCAGFRRTDL